ncbi:unnamed protein product [Oikopleura dioica]|uniref:Uncharacterized protein n=1 Tax=Oikopleura dioica TaxID=34765 RepID=E4YBY2_OIKDI|nr:unnamed protein product [Oikopleura dioica]
MTITTQPQSGDWKYGMFDCCGDVKTCCFVYCCSCLSAKRIQDSLNDNGSAVCLLQGSKFAMRIRTIAKNSNSLRFASHKMDSTSLRFRFAIFRQLSLSLRFRNFFGLRIRNLFA